MENTFKSPVESSREVLANDAQNLSRDVGQTVQHARDHAYAQYDYVKGQSSETYNLFKSYVSNKPLTTIGVAMLVGYVVAAFRNQCSK